MGEWSEYFEDFPEEDPSNYRGGHFVGRAQAEEFRRRERYKADKLATEQAQLDAEIKAIIQKHSKPSKP